MPEPSRSRTRLLIGVLCTCLVALLLPACIRTAPPPESKPQRGAPTSRARSATEATTQPERQPEPTPTPTRKQRMLDAAGPGWVLATYAELNGDEDPEVVLYKPSDVVLAEEFLDPLYTEYTLVVSELMIARMGEDGRFQKLLHVAPQEIIAGESRLMSLITFPQAEAYSVPSAFLTTYPESGDTQITIIPLNESGERYMQSVGVFWNKEKGGYRLVLSRDD